MYKFEEAIKSGLSPEQITSYLSSQGRAKEAEAYFTPKGESFVSKVKSDITSRRQSVEQDIDLASESKISSPELILRSLGQGAGLLGDLGGRILGKGITMATPKPVEDAVKKGGQAILNTSAGQAGMQALAAGIDVYQKWKEKNTRLAENLEATLNIASIIPPAKGVQVTGQALRQIPKLGKSYLDNMAQALAKRNPKTLTQTIPNAAESIKRGVSNVFERGKGKLQQSIETSQKIRQLPEVEARLVSAGLDERVLGFVKTSKAKDVDAYKDMFNIAKSRMGEDGLRISTQPKEVVGKTISSRARYVINKRKSVGKQIGDVVNNLPEKFVSIKKESEQFTDYLRGIGVRVGNEGKLINTGIVPSADMGAYQLMYDLLRPPGATLKKLHGLRQRIFKEFDLAKARQQPFSDTADTTAEVFRRILAKPLDIASNGKYMKLNTQYAEMSKPIRDFVQLMGYKGDLDGITEKNLRAAEIATRMLSNVADRPTTVLSDLEATAFKYGMKINDSVWDQLQVADFMEDLFGTFQRSSLQGRITRAGQELGLENVLQKGVRGAAFDTLKGLTTPERQELIDKFGAFLFSRVKEKTRSI